nr:Dihydrofolate reductase [uncultured bacterium]
MILSIIVAVSENGVIGKDNKLIWHLPADMKFFREKTTGHFIITGRKNYESIPEKFRPLPDRTNIVITRQKNYHPAGTIIASSIPDALSFAEEFSNKEEVFIIGGAEIFNQVLPSCHRVYLTRIHEKFEGDVFFKDLPPEWKLIFSEKHEPDAKNKYPFTFETWEKN